MSIELASIHPTRLELLRLKRRKSMAEGIVDILKKDLDALTLKLFELVKNVSPLREKIDRELKNAFESYLEAEMITGSKRIEEISLTAESLNFRIKETKKKELLGLMLPILDFQLEQRLIAPRFNLLDTTVSLDKSILKIKFALKEIVKLAELESSIKIILEVMATKKRQMNRIQFKILPELNSAIRYIELILEETERQDAIRVRVLQRKRKERTST
jgi:V/A-type H+-transporting ATPase subunit D